MAKSSSKPEAVAVAADRPTKKSQQPTTLADGDVARRAYDLFQARGGEHGHDIEDWLQAERELNMDAEC